VDVKLVANHAHSRWDYDWLAFDSKADVANESLVKDSINSFALVVSALGQAFQCGAIGLGKGHDLKIVIKALSVVSRESQ